MAADSSGKYTAATLRVKLAEVLESWPLYRRFAYHGESLHFVNEQAVGRPHFGLLPESIRLYCSHGDCGNFQLWECGRHEVYFGAERFKQRTYTCRNCKRREITYIFHWDEDNGSTGGLFIKVGQYPPLRHTPPKELERRLDKEDYDFYVKALDCRNFSYGLAAVAYMRRVVENQTNDMPDLIAETLKAQGALPEILAKIEKVKTSIVYEDKLEVAQTVLRSRLVRNGVNPIKYLHGLTSAALHEESEEECIDVFDHARAAFEYVFSELEVERLRADQYSETIRKLNKKVNL
jgi:hypothetical protein